MAFATPEQVHRYPRRFKWIFEVLCTVLIVVAVVRWGRAVLQYLWDSRNINAAFEARDTFYEPLVNWFNQTGTTRPRLRDLTDLAPYFGWLGLTLLVVVFVRNFFPTIRTSSRGILIEWGNSWLPVGWEQVNGLRVTEDLSGERFVVLLQTNNKAMTGWHRFYSVLYRFSLRRGVLITSGISDFLPLVRMLTSELEQVARQTKQPAVKLDEKASSPLFQLLLSPAGFFSRRSKSDKDYVEYATQAGLTAQPGRVASIMATYPKRISSLLVIGTAVMAVLGLLRVLEMLRQWIGLSFGVGGIFNSTPLPLDQSVWWLPVAAVLLLVVLLPILVVIRNILPDIESRQEGLMVRYFNRWLLVRWEEIIAVKTASLSENNHVMLIQTTNQSLKLMHHISSLLFDGSNARGVLLTSALSVYDPLVQQIVLEVSRRQRPNEQDEGILTEDAPAWLLRLMFKPSDAIDRMVSNILRREDSTKIKFDTMITLGRPMLWLAAIPTLMLLVERHINGVHYPTVSSIINVLVFVFICLLEYPIAAAVAQFSERNMDGDAHLARPFYLYPTAQLPRIVVMLGALLLLVLNVPLLPVLLWIGAAIWSFLLTAGLWEGLYGWSGGKLLGIGAIPAIIQVLALMMWASMS